MSKSKVRTIKIRKNFLSKNRELPQFFSTPTNNNFANSRNIRNHKTMPDFYDDIHHFL